MPDPIARKRLKKKMLDRWENEGGSIAPDAISEDVNGPGSENQGTGKKISSRRDTSTAVGPASPTKSPKPNRK